MKIYDKIPSMFFETNYKVKKDILDRKKTDIEDNTRDVWVMLI
jgi:hypothetical protein